jgi:hypothetical protein
MDSQLNVEIMNRSNQYYHISPHKIIMLARCINNQTAMSQILRKKSGYWSLKVKPCYICNYSEFLDKCNICPVYDINLVEPAVMRNDIASGPWKCIVKSGTIGIEQMKVWQFDKQKTTAGRLAQQIICVNGNKECYVTFKASSKTQTLNRGTTIGQAQLHSNLPPITVCNKIHHFLVTKCTQIPEHTSLEIEVKTVESSDPPLKCHTEYHGIEVTCSHPVLKVSNGFINRYVFSEKMAFTLHNMTNQSVSLNKDQVILVAACFSGHYQDMYWRHEKLQSFP